MKSISWQRKGALAGETPTKVAGFLVVGEFGKFDRQGLFKVEIEGEGQRHFLLDANSWRAQRSLMNHIYNSRSVETNRFYFFFIIIFFSSEKLSKSTSTFRKLDLS